MTRITKRMSRSDGPEQSWTGPEPTRRRRLGRDYGVAAAVVAGAVLAVSAVAEHRGEPDRSPVAAEQGAAPSGQPDAASPTAPGCSWSVAPEALDAGPRCRTESGLGPGQRAVRRRLDGTRRLVDPGRMRPRRGSRRVGQPRRRGRAGGAQRQARRPGQDSRAVTPHRLNPRFLALLTDPWV
jgi:hypothetical protein